MPPLPPKLSPLSVRQLIENNSNGLTKAQKVGIGIGVTAAGLIFILAVWFYARSRAGIWAVMSKGNPHHGTRRDRSARKPSGKTLG